MTLKYLAVVSPAGEELYACSEALDWPAAAQAWKAVQGQHNGPVHLVASETKQSEQGALVELATPWARAEVAANPAEPAPARACVAVWHAKEPSFGLGDLQSSYRIEDFEHVATLVVPSREIASRQGPPFDALNAAFASSQNIDDSWRPGYPCRSSSVGDIFVCSGDGLEEAFVVCSVGFEAIEFS